MFNELLRNGSGYIDITAYIAIKNCEKGEKSMEFKRGEIFEYEMNGGESRVALVVSSDERANEKYINIILLNDKESIGGDNYPVTMLGGVMYANCKMITLATNDRFLGFVKRVKESEMIAIDAAIAANLGLNATKEVKEEKEIAKEEVATGLCYDIEAAEEAAALKAEVRIYKELYEKLLERMMK